MNEKAFDDSKIWMYEDLKGLDPDRHYEIIEGVLFELSTPSIKHQAISAEILKQIASYLENKPCNVFHAPIDINFSKKKKKATNIVQPDIVVVCDQNKIKEQYIKGAPDFIIEILSPSTKARDRFYKYNLYIKEKVKEYWIVDPIKNKIEVYLLEKEYFECIGTYPIADKVKVNIFQDFSIDLSEFYLKNASILKEEMEEYEIERSDVKEYFYGFDSIDLKEYEKEILEKIYAYNTIWDYEEREKLGGFKNNFEVIEGKLVYHS